MTYFDQQFFNMNWTMYNNIIVLFNFYNVILFII